MRDGAGAIGAIAAAAAVALAAYASHAAAPDDRARLFVAAAMAFGHGLAVLALAALPLAKPGRFARWWLLAGMLAFSGSLVLRVFAGTPAVLAPAGGIAMISGWLLLAFDRLFDRLGD